MIAPACKEAGAFVYGRAGWARFSFYGVGAAGGGAGGTVAAAVVAEPVRRLYQRMTAKMQYAPTSEPTAIATICPSTGINPMIALITPAMIPMTIRPKNSIAVGPKFSRDKLIEAPIEPVPV